MRPPAAALGEHRGKDRLGKFDIPERLLSCTKRCTKEPPDMCTLISAKCMRPLNMLVMDRVTWIVPPTSTLFKVPSELPK